MKNQFDTRPFGPIPLFLFRPLRSAFPKGVNSIRIAVNPQVSKPAVITE